MTNFEKKINRAFTCLCHFLMIGIFSITPTQAQQVSGTVNNEFQHVTQFMKDYVNDTGVTSATLQVRKRSGSTVLRQGFGWLNSAQTLPTQANSMLRVASISKSITRLAIEQLIAAGTLSRTAKAFCLGGQTPSGNTCLISVTPTGQDGVPDSRAQNITLDHLLLHQAGWDEGLKDSNNLYDPLSGSVTIANILGVISPPSYQEMLNYQLDQNLHHDPGTYRYSNFGYAILGYIVELYSGLSYIDYVHQNITSPLAVPVQNIKLGSEVVAGRDAREPNYVSTDGANVQNFFDPTGPLVKRPDGAILIARAAGAGGIIADTDALLDYSTHYWLWHFKPRNPLETDPHFDSEWVASGGGDGTLAFVTQNSPLDAWGDRAEWAAAFNNSANSHNLHTQYRIRAAIRNTLKRDVTLYDIDGFAAFDQVMGFYLPENASNLTVTFQGFGAHNCSGLQVWNSSTQYSPGSVVRDRGVKFTANTSNSNTQAYFHHGASQAWTWNGYCNADTEVYIKRAAKPTTTNYDCRSIAAGANHSCSINNAVAGFYYVIMRSADGYDYHGISARPTYTTASTTCTSPVYVDGTSYNTNDLVQNINNEYQCTVGGWCSIGGPYEPGVGWAWTNAWTLVRSCL